MSHQPSPSHARLAQPPSGGYSTGGSTSSRGSSMGHDSFGFGAAVQEQGSRYNDGQFTNLPSNVKLPPSLHNQQGHSQVTHGEYRPTPVPRPAPQSHDPGSTRGPIGYNGAVPTSMSQGGGERSNTSGAVSVNEICRKLDFASKENTKLVDVLHETNEQLESKLQEIERYMETTKKLREKNEELTKEVQQLRQQHTESTNKFFEARVAVLGYKCRTMQLAGELKEKGYAMQQQGSGQPHSFAATPNDAHLKQRIQRLEAENEQLKRSNPGGASAANFQALQREKYELEAEKKNYMAIVAQLTNDLEEVQSKKDAALRDGNQLEQEVSQLRRELQTLQADRSAMQGHMQELTEQRGKIDRQLRDVRKRNSDLLHKVNELEESRSAIHAKLERQSQEHPVKQKAPTPKPRTNIQGIPLQVKEQLESEKRELQELLDREKSMRERVESRLSKENQKLQEMIEKQNHLEHNVVSLRSELELKSRQESSMTEQLQTLRAQASSGSGDKVLVEQLQRNIDRKEKQLALLNDDKTSLQTRVAQLEKAVTEQRQQVEMVREEKQKEVGRVKRDKDRKISELEEQLQKLSLKPSESESSPAPTAAPRGGKPQQQMRIRLNDALGQLKKKESEIEQLQRQLSEERERFEEEKGSLAQQNTKLQQEVLTDYEHRLQSTENRVTQLQRQITDYEQAEQRLVTESLQHSQEKERLHQELSLREGNLRDAESRLSSIQRQLTERQKENEQLVGSLAQVQQQLSVEEYTKNEHSGRVKHLEEKLSSLQDQYARTKTELQELQDAKERFISRIHELNTERDELSKQRTVLIEEKADVETTCSEFQKESESILKDYDTCAQRLHDVTKERDSLRSEVTRLTMEVSKSADKMRQVEQQRDESSERLSHMDAQLKLYHEDFERERQAREASIKVKTLAEERMKKMERDMKDLRERLNRQAAKRLQEDPYEETGVASSAAVMQEARLSGEQQRNLSGPHQPPLNTSGNQMYGQPQQFAQGGQYVSPPQPAARRSGEQPANFMPQQQQPQHSMVTGHHEPAPALPPRERPPQQVQLPVSAASGGGGGYPLQPAVNQPWMTQQFPHQQPPPTVQPSGRVHPMTVSQGLAMANSRMDQPMANSRMDQPMANSRMDPTNDLNQRGPLRAVGPPGPSTMAPAQIPINDLNMPPQTTIGLPAGQQGRYVSPGEVMNTAPPMASCPLCGKKDFRTQTDLELHCAQCTADNM